MGAELSLFWHKYLRSRGFIFLVKATAIKFSEAVAHKVTDAKGGLGTED